MRNPLRIRRSLLSVVLPCAGLLGAVLPGMARAGSSGAGEEFLSVTEAAEPNIIFLVDLASDMSSPCLGSASTLSCLDEAKNAIDLVTQHFDWARFAVVGTSPDGAFTHTCNDGSGSTRTAVYGDDFFPVAPLGASHAEITDALASLNVHTTTGSNVGEALSALAGNYLSDMDAQNDIDDDCDGVEADFTEAGVEFWCQDTHIIVLTNKLPNADEGVPAAWVSTGLATDVTCDSTGRTTTRSTTDEQCDYDNVVHDLYNTDLRPDLSGTQNVTVHTIGLNTSSLSVAEELYGNASDQIGGAGIYASASDSASLLSSILLAMQDIRSGSFSRSTPVLSAAGNYLIYSFYTLNGDDIVRRSEGMALGQGHIRAYAVDDDPASVTYGQVQYTGPTEFGGAVWDGGDLLVSRLVTSTEFNPQDRDGVGRRDIYTFWEPAYGLGGAVASEADADGRMSFDRSFVEDIAADDSVLNLILDNTSGGSCASDLTYDLSKDGCNVNELDLQALVDFARGWELSEFRYLSETRGRWRLGDAPHSIPVVVEAYDNNFAIEPSYREFLDGLRKDRDEGRSPDIVLMAANDGMLHAFRLEDDPATGESEDGEELWAWIPGYLLEREHDATWSGRLVDLMLFGRTFLFDGSPVVEDVWIDLDNDGMKECNSVPEDCEWRRVVVVQQGKGGPVTLALDITDTNDPIFLWEQVDEVDPSAQGYGVGRPAVGMVYDATGVTSPSGEPIDRWVAFWGSGRGVPYGEGGSSTSSYEMTEANVYAWHLGDDRWGTTSLKLQGGTGSPRGENVHPEASLGSALQLDTDAAGHLEYGYISAALAVVDVDSDGDVDTMYFPVTTSYKPTSEGGSGPGDASDPGSTWLYKACIRTDAPGELDFVEFFDPIADGGLSARPEVYYAATTAWHRDGSLGVYWGTGTPYSRIGLEAGYFFAVKDTAPSSCTDDGMEPLTDCGAAGVLPLDAGEGLTADPVVYAGTVFFSTWVPEADRCDGGTGRLYGISYTDCTPMLDTNGDGVTTAADDRAVEEADSYISGVAISDKGTLFYGTSNDTEVSTLSISNDPYLGTATMAWMEVF